MSILLSGCFKSESGYGHKAREILHSVFQKYKDETLYILNLDWGSTPNDGLKNSKYEYLEEHIKPFQLNKQPELHIHVGVPNDLYGNFSFVGKKNILFTSGVETDVVPLNWIRFLNQKRVDLIVVPSKYVKEVFEKTVYTETKEDKTTVQHKLERPVVVVPESYDDRLFEPLTDQQIEHVESLLNPINGTDFFLSCGQVSAHVASEKGSDRKNISGLIENFITTFRGNKHISLVLKTNPVEYSEISYYYQLNYYKRILKDTMIPKEERPNILLIKGHLKPNELFYLYKHEKNVANVSYTHGEGFGRFILDASLSGNRLVVPKFGGFKDFTSNSFSYYINGIMKKIPHSAIMHEILIPESKWFHVDMNEASKILKQVYKEHSSYKVSKETLKHIQYLTNHYSIDNITNMIQNTIEPFYSKKIQLDESIFKIEDIPNLIK